MAWTLTPIRFVSVCGQNVACFLVRAQGQVVYGQALDIRYHRHSHVVAKTKNHFAHISVSFYLYLFLFFCLWFGFLSISFVPIYEYVWILLMKCSEKCMAIEFIWFWIYCLNVSFVPLPLSCFVSLLLFRYYKYCNSFTLTILYPSKLISCKLKLK